MGALIERFIPTPLLAIGVVLLLAWLVSAVHGDGFMAGKQSCQLERADHALAKSEGSRAGEAATTNARTEAADAQDDRTNQIQARAVAASDAAGRLRSATTDAVRRAQRCTEGGAQAEQSRKAIEALAAVFGSCQAEQRAMAEAAERHLSAGLRCEAEYDALSASARAPGESEPEPAQELDHGASAPDLPTSDEGSGQ